MSEQEDHAVTTSKTLDEDKKLRRIRSFVVRSGRMTAGQQRAYDKNWPIYGLEQDGALLDYAQAFGRSSATVLEIGFGMGDSLVTMAAEAPNTNFLAIEVHRPGIGALLLGMETKAVNNIRAYCDDAISVLENSIPDASLDRVQLYFPDPWQKKRHNKRRIVQLPFVEQIRTKLKPGGIFHMATDWEPYAEHMLITMKSAPGYQNTCEGYAVRPEFRPLTKFEKRGQRLGHGVWDLLFERVDG